MSKIVDEVFENQYAYALLDRMKSDCEYFLFPRANDEKYLWAKDIDTHIAIMKEIYERFPDDEKPEWISMSEIISFEEKMKEKIHKNHSAGG